jgi:hypothetical protein
MDEFFDLMCDRTISEEDLARIKTFLQECSSGERLEVTCMFPEEIVFRGTYSGDDDKHLHFLNDGVLFHMPWGRIKSIAK